MGSNEQPNKLIAIERMIQEFGNALTNVMSDCWRHVSKVPIRPRWKMI
jgi:hypothetical protein